MHLQKTQSVAICVLVRVIFKKRRKINSQVIIIIIIMVIFKCYFSGELIALS